LTYIASIEGATWGVARAFWLPNGASVKRLIRRAPDAREIGASCATLLPKSDSTRYLGRGTVVTRGMYLTCVWFFYSGRIWERFEGINYNTHNILLEEAPHVADTSGSP